MKGQPATLATLVYGFRDGRVVMMHRAKPPNLALWSPPGGKLLPGETPLDAALREFTEETGLVARHARLRAVVAELDVESGEAWLIHAFRADVPDGDLVEFHPEGRLAWVATSDVPRLATPSVDPVIFEAISADAGIASIAVRMHSGRLEAVRVARG